MSAVRVEMGGVLVEQLDAFEGLIGQRNSARACAVALEQQCDALTERLHQLAGMVPHLEGEGRFHGSCLTCGMPWPCRLAYDDIEPGEL